MQIPAITFTLQQRCEISVTVPMFHLYAYGWPDSMRSKFQNTGWERLA